MPKSTEIKESSHISQISANEGFKTHKTVWDANSSLKSKRKNPNILFHGDRYNPGDNLSVPDFADKEESGSTERHHVFKVENEKLFLRIRVLAEDYTAVKNADYELAVGSVPTPFIGKTDGKGQIEVEIPRDAVGGKLTVRVPGKQTGGQSASNSNSVQGPVPCTWTLQIGALNPIMENAPDKWCIAGVQQRLNNLCLNTGPIDGILGPNTTASVKAFQTLFGLNVDGKPGQLATQPKLVEVHDKPDSVLGPKPEPEKK